MYRTITIRTTRSLAVPSRTLHSSPVTLKSATEKAKEVASDVNIKIGKTLASAIDKGEKAAQSAKETVGVGAKEGTEKVKQKGNQAAAGATEAKEDFKREMKK